MRYSELEKSVQGSIARRFNLPQDTTNVEVDEHLRPFIRNKGLNYISLKRNAIVGGGFHIHELKNQ